MALHGYAILDNKGKQIGVWYSYFGVRGYVRMVNETTVEIGTPMNAIAPELSAPLKRKIMRCRPMERQKEQKL